MKPSFGLNNSARTPRTQERGKVAAILEFVRSDSMVFDPEAVQVLASALDDAWARIEKAGS